MKEFVIKDSAAFRLRVKMWKCLTPSDLNSIEFIQECKDENGEVNFSSTYNYFLTDEDIKVMVDGFSK
jgi:hypothetical protein